MHVYSVCRLHGDIYMVHARVQCMSITWRQIHGPCTCIVYVDYTATDTWSMHVYSVCRLHGDIYMVHARV